MSQACGILSLLDIFYTSLTSVLSNLEHGLAILTESFSPSELHKLPCWSPKQKWCNKLRYSLFVMLTHWPKLILLVLTNFNHLGRALNATLLECNGTMYYHAENLMGHRGGTVIMGITAQKYGLKLQTPQNIPQTSNFLLSPTKSMVANGNQW